MEGNDLGQTNNHDDDDAPVLGRQLVATRQFVDEYGLVEARQFEDRLRQQAVAG